MGDHTLGQAGDASVVPQGAQQWRGTQRAEAPLVLTGAGSGKGEPQPCASPPGRLGFAPPPAPPGCWHTAPCVTAGCPGCCCCSPCGQGVSIHPGTLFGITHHPQGWGRQRYLLNLRSWTLIWLKSGRSRTSSAQQCCISWPSSSMWHPTLAEGRKLGHSPLFTRSMISAGPSTRQRVQTSISRCKHPSAVPSTHHSRSKHPSARPTAHHLVQALIIWSNNASAGLSTHHSLSKHPSSEANHSSAGPITISWFKHPPAGAVTHQQVQAPISGSNHASVRATTHQL